MGDHTQLWVRVNLFRSCSFKKIDFQRDSTQFWLQELGNKPFATSTQDLKWRMYSKPC